MAHGAGLVQHKQERQAQHLWRQGVSGFKGLRLVQHKQGCQVRQGYQVRHVWRGFQGVGFQGLPPVQQSLEALLQGFSDGFRW